VRLATTTDGKGSGAVGTGAKPVGPAGYDGPSGSDGATSRAPRTRSSCGKAAICAQCATSRQAVLWATSTTGVSLARIAASRVCTHSAHTGAAQSRCRTRTACCGPSVRSMWLCQWSGPESYRPGSSRWHETTDVSMEVDIPKPNRPRAARAGWRRPTCRPRPSSLALEPSCTPRPHTVHRTITPASSTRKRPPGSNSCR
jgi:hypothetical protein